MRRQTTLAILALLTIALIISSFACGHPVPDSGPSETEAPSISSLAESLGGNLHYQNLVLAVNDQIVFNSGSGQMSIAEADGSMSIQLVDTAGNCPAYDGNRLFYIGGSAGGQLSKVDLDGTNQVRIGQTTLKYLMTYDSQLYAIESDTGMPISLKTDGTGRKLLCETQAIALALADDRLFITGAAAASGLTVIDLATGEQQVLLSQQISSLNIVGDWLYFSDPNNGFRLNAWSLSAGKGSQISSFGIDKAFIISNGYIYYISTINQSRLYRLPISGNSSLDGQAPELVADDAVSSFVVCDDYVYYQRPTSARIYRVDAGGSTPMRIT